MEARNTLGKEANLERGNTKFVITASDSNGGVWKTFENVGQKDTVENRDELWIWGCLI